jgi:hypothetical protein
MSLATSRREVSLRLTESKPSLTLTASAHKAFWQTKKQKKQETISPERKIVLSLFRTIFSPWKPQVVFSLASSYTLEIVQHVF